MAELPHCPAPAADASSSVALPGIADQASADLCIALQTEMRRQDFIHESFLRFPFYVDQDLMPASFPSRARCSQPGASGYRDPQKPTPSRVRHFQAQTPRFTLRRNWLE